MKNLLLVLILAIFFALITISYMKVGIAAIDKAEKEKDQIQFDENVLDWSE